MGKTFIPEMFRKRKAGAATPASPYDPSTPDSDTTAKQRALIIQPRAIVGVLFSVSRDTLGELLPVYVGRNTIGSALDSDVCLLEETVSEKHAVLLVRQEENLMGEIVLKASLTDYDTDFGTTVDGVPLGFEKVECHDRSIITIGNSYKLMLILCNAEDFGLRTADNFQAIPQREMTEMPVYQPQPAAVVATAVAAAPVIPQKEEMSDDDAADFYAPTKPRQNDNLNAKTVV